MIISPEIKEATRNISSLLEGLGLPHAIGGAVAMGLLGHVRATRDVDLLLLLPALRSQEFADAAHAAGFRMRDDSDAEVPVTPAQMTTSTREVGHFRIWWREVKLEIFSPKVPLQDSVLKRRIRSDVGDFSLWITTAEDLILLKMIFHRDKDLVDVRRLLAANRDSLDVPYVKSWIPRTLEPAAGAELEDMLKRTGLA
ncbi:MAG: hypothetical protein HYY93_10060 [Planctomycetes bacterium]|nr:hypothetical protein [Planctomycetota bacterium]